MTRFDKLLRLAPLDSSLSKRYIEQNRSSIGDKTADLLLSLKSLLKSNKPISHLSSDEKSKSSGAVLGITRVIRAGFAFWPEQFSEYLSKQAYLFTLNREKITQNGFYKKVFGVSASDYRSDSKGHEKHCIFLKRLWSIIGVEVSRQNILFPATNRKAMKMGSDVWILYWIKGTSLQSGTHDFSGIKSPYYKAAFKSYLKNGRWYHKVSFRNDNIDNFAIRAFNHLSEVEKISKPAYVTNSHARVLLFYLTKEAKSCKKKNLKSSTIRSHFKLLRTMWNFLIENPEFTPKGQPPIVKNPFESVSFKHEADRYESSEPIPDEVINQITPHLQSIVVDFRRVFEVSLGTGLRAQDTILLQEGCLKYDDDLQMHVLTYINHKSSNTRLRQGLSEYRHISVWDPIVVKAIQDQEQATKHLREESGKNFIFLRKSQHSTRINVVSDHGYTMSIRRIIKVANICDLSGRRWKFKSHQCRKTLSVRMIEKGIPIHDLQIHIDHQNPATTERYYAEVRRTKLAEMNTRFFQRKFETDVGKKQLGSFKEEERRRLYEDFCLGVREVEFGQCTKHAKDGQCGKRTGHTSCAICPQICTGIKYESKWAKSVASAKRDVTEFEKSYAAAGISKQEYKDYREYQRALRNMQNYQAGLARAQEFRSN